MITNPIDYNDHSLIMTEDTVEYNCHNLIRTHRILRNYICTKCLSKIRLYGWYEIFIDGFWQKITLTCEEQMIKNILE